MHPSESSTEYPRDPRIDLLVDGELAPQERRDLLLACEAHPELWRTCALAFLEAQAWRADFQGAPRELVAMAPPIPESRSFRFGGGWRSLVALAACVVASFYIGRGTRPDSGGSIAAVPERPASAPQPTPELPQELPVESLAAHHPQPAENADPEEKPAVASQRPIAGNAQRGSATLTIKYDQQGVERELKIPVHDIPESELLEWARNPVAVNAFAVQALERRGHKLEAQRQLVTLNLKDGKKVILPVEHFDLHLAHRVFQ
jgi:hypothetical protein